VSLKQDHEGNLVKSVYLVLMVNLVILVLVVTEVIKVYRVKRFPVDPVTKDQEVCLVQKVNPVLQEKWVIKVFLDQLV